MVVKMMAMTIRENGNDNEDGWDGKAVILSGKPSLTVSSPLEIGRPSSPSLYNSEYTST